MRWFLRATVVFLLLLASRESRAETQRIMPLDEVRPGMRGHGLTVFRGTTPERFDIEVVGVLHQFLTRQDLILIRMDHPLLQRSGTVGGMSGSPIYVNGRLIGALAYGWLFAMDPIAGVTPIESMLEELDRPLEMNSINDPAPARFLLTQPATQSSRAGSSNFRSEFNRERLRRGDDRSKSA